MPLRTYWPASLKLRSEYDRAFLYRCMAAGKSSGARQYRAGIVLNTEQKQQVYLQIGNYLKKSYKGTDAGSIDAWRERLKKNLKMDD